MSLITESLSYLKMASPLYQAVMWILLGCAIGTVFVSLERYYHYMRARADLNDVLPGLFNVLKNKKIIEAVSVCDKTAGPVAAVLRSIILRAGAEETQLRKAAAEAGGIEMGRLEQRLGYLAFTVYFASMLGLLGVLVAMAQALPADPSVAQSRLPLDVLVPHLRMGIVAASAGLAVSIMNYAAYHYFLFTLDHFRLDMEKASMEMINFLVLNRIRRDDPAAGSRKEA